MIISRIGKLLAGNYTCVSGAQMKVPIPEPQTAMPVAKARCFSKYIETQTIAGR